MGIAGDVLWRVADFPEAQILAQRWRRVIPPNITGDAPNPQLTEAMEQAAQKIEQQLGIIAKQQQELADRGREFDIKERELELKEKTAGHDAVVEAVREIREDFKAITDRLTALGNAGPIITPEQIKPLINQAVEESLANGQSFGEIASENVGNSAELKADLSEPPVEDAKQAPDGQWYVPNPEGGHLMVEHG